VVSASCAVIQSGKTTKACAMSAPNALNLRICSRGLEYAQRKKGTVEEG